MKKITLTAISALAALGIAGTANAASVSSQLFNGFQLLSDNSAEYLVKGANNTDPLLATTVEVGDSLSGILSIDTVEQTGSANHLGSGGVNELTAIFQITVVGKDTNGVNGCATAFCFSFAPSTSFATDLSGDARWAGVDTTGAMVAFYEDSANDYNRLGTDLNADIASASGGSAFWLAGIGGANDFWAANAVSDNIAAIGATPVPGNGGGYNVGLSLLGNPHGPMLDLVNCLNGPVNFCGSGSLLGTGGATTPFDSFDDVNFAVNVVPEPATLGVFGLGLLGMGAFARRRRKAA